MRTSATSALDDDNRKIRHRAPGTIARAAIGEETIKLAIY
jgi:hypothetical protein